MIKRVLIAVGGTGGHVYPAVAFARKLKATIPGIRLMFAGGGLEENPFFDKVEFPCHGMACGNLPFAKPWKLFQNMGKIAWGIWKSGRIIKEFKPDLVIGFGSYHSLPLLLSARMLSIPIILHEANAIPGRVNRLLAKRALFTGIQFPEAARYLSGKTVAINTLLREELSRAKGSREKAIAYFGLAKNLPILLAFGGSQGALAINKLLTEIFSDSAMRGIQVIHFTGSREETKRVARCYQMGGVRHFVNDFEKNMGMAWAAADLFAGRAGASTIAEAMEFEVPALLIPYPHAMDGHQARNAHFMAVEVGGAVLLDESEASPQRLGSEILSLLQNDSLPFQKMRQAIKNYKENVRYPDLSHLVAARISQ